MAQAISVRDLAGSISRRTMIWFSAIAAAALVAGAVIAIGAAASKPPPLGAGHSILESSSQGQLTIERVQASAFSTTVAFRLRLEQPLQQDESIAVAPERTVLTFEGSTTEFTPAELAYEISPDRSSALVTATFRTAPLADGFSLTVGEFAVIPNDGDGRPSRAAITATGRVTAARVGAASRHLAQPRTIDTGFGWSYVIDSVENEGAVWRIRYHVAGDTAGLRRLPAEADGGAVALPFPDDGSTGEVVVERAAGWTPSIVLGAAGRPIQSAHSFAFTLVGGLWQPVQADTGIKGTLAIDKGMISIRVESAMAFTGRGSPGNSPVLRDDLGNVYALYHGSGSFPASFSQWDFSGPLKPGVQGVRLDVAGYLKPEVISTPFRLD